NNWQIMTTPTIASSNNLPKAEPPTVTAKTGTSKSTPTRTTKQKSTNTKSGSTANDDASADTANTGVQPTWSALRLPSSESNDAPIDNKTPHNSAYPATVPELLNLPNKILLTLLIVVFLLVLLWRWRLYKKRDAQKPI